MSFNNFVSTVWSENIVRARERFCVAATLCNREYEGAISDSGDTVKILGVGRPTVATYTKNSTVISPEVLSDLSTTLTIDKSEYFAFKVDDIDKRQAAGNVLAALQDESAAAMAESMDTSIYANYASAGKNITNAALTSANTFSTLLSALTWLWKQNVPKTEKISIEVSPDVMEKIILAKIIRMNPNSDGIENGFDSLFQNCKIYMSNGIAQPGGVSKCIVRTKKAIALADTLSMVEAYRPESGFCDAVKGLHLYGSKVVRPAELVCLSLTPAAETAI